MNVEASLFCIHNAVRVHSQLPLLFVCLCVYVTIALLPSVLIGTCPYFYSSGTVSVYTTVPCCASTGVETVLCWHSTAQFEHSSVVFTLTFRSVLC